MARGFGPSRGRSPMRNPGGFNQNPMGDLFRGGGSDYYGGRGGMYDLFRGNSYYRHEDSMARAYRDAAMINAAVGLVGIMVHASQTANYGAIAPAPAPAAVPLVTPTPAGRWERQAVVLQPQRREEQQVWVPESYDAQTGQKTGGGYYEIRTRIIPEVVQYHDAWVAP